MEMKRITKPNYKLTGPVELRNMLRVSLNVHGSLMGDLI